MAPSRSVSFLKGVDLEDEDDLNVVQKRSFSNVTADDNLQNQNQSAALTPSFSLRAALLEANIIPTLLNALYRHPTDVTIVKGATTALMHLANSPSPE